MASVAALAAPMGSATRNHWAPLTAATDSALTWAKPDHTAAWLTSMDAMTPPEDKTNGYRKLCMFIMCLFNSTRPGPTTMKAASTNAVYTAFRKDAETDVRAAGSVAPSAFL